MIDPSLIAQFGIPALVAAGALGMAFAPKERRAMFEKFRGECQADDCIGLFMYEERNSYYNGHHVHMAHKTGTHKPGELDTEMENGTCHCTGCHIIQHIRIALETGNDDDMKHARLIYNGHTIRSYGYIRSLMPNHDPDTEIDKSWDEKPPFEFYLEYARYGSGMEFANEKWALAQGMRVQLARQREEKKCENQENFFFIMDQQSISNTPS